MPFVNRHRMLIKFQVIVFDMTDFGLANMVSLPPLHRGSPVIHNLTRFRRTIYPLNSSSNASKPTILKASVRFSSIKHPGYFPVSSYRSTQRCSSTVSNTFRRLLGNHQGLAGSCSRFESPLHIELPRTRKIYCQGSHSPRPWG